MERIRPEEYIFSCSLIRGEEKTLLGDSDLERLADADTVPQALQLLASFGYGDGKDTEDRRSYETVFRNELKRVRELIFSVAPYDGDIRILYMPEDYHNLKVILKSEALGTAPEAMMTDTGNMDGSKLKTAVFEKNYSDMSETMKQAVISARESFARSGDPQEIDLIMDRACYREMNEKAELSSSDFVKGYVKLLVDLLNINAFVRLREMEKPADFFMRVFLTGGNLEMGLFRQLYNEQYTQAADRFAAFGYRDLIALGAMKAYEYGDYTLMEKLSDNTRIEYLRGSRFVTYGVEPVFAFLAAKESEVKNLRIIMSGKIAGLSPQVVKERLRAAYV